MNEKLVSLCFKTFKEKGERYGFVPYVIESVHSKELANGRLIQMIDDEDAG